MTRRDGGAEGVADSAGETAEAAKKAVVRYLLCLFLAVMFFTGLSYLIQNRDNSRMNKLYSENATATQHIETMREEYGELQQKYDELLALYNNLLDEIRTEVSTND